MLKQCIKENLETSIQYTIQKYSEDETLAYDVSKQCVTEGDVDKCLETMLEHISEEELELIFRLFKSDLFNRYTQAVTESMRVIDRRIQETLFLLSCKAGEA